MEFKLERIFTCENYTIGKLFIDNEYFCDTIEDSDRGLTKDMSIEDAEGDALEDQDENDFAGYANTLAIQEFAQESYGGLAYSNLRAAYVAVNYAGADVEPVPVPENTTGWFFPSAGQMKAIYAAASEITASLETAGGTEVTGDFWSSTTVAGSTPVQAYCIHIQSGSISVEGLNQTRVWKVRPILAF